MHCGRAVSQPQATTAPSQCSKESAGSGVEKEAPRLFADGCVRPGVEGQTSLRGDRSQVIGPPQWGDRNGIGGLRVSVCRSGFIRQPRLLGPSQRASSPAAQCAWQCRCG